MALKLITPPEPFVVTLEETKAQLRVDSADDDAIITRMIAAATAHVDGNWGWLHRALKPQTYELLYDNFPCGPIAIPMRPLLEVLSVKYDDENGDEQTVSALSYWVDIVSDPGWVVPVSDFSWPTTIDTVNAARIRFRAGYEDAIESESGADTATSTVPEPIRHAILMMVADLYQHRESVSADAMSDVPIPSTVKALLHPYRVFA